MSQAFDQLFEFIILLSSNTAPEVFPFIFITFSRLYGERDPTPLECTTWAREPCPQCF